jgi:DNA-binding transcriptional ArsR family regulator
MTEPEAVRRLTDPRALRALAHPVRLELMGVLRYGGPLTATQAAERLGQTPSSCSFHLRQLAKYGLVEEAGGGRGRERPWRATAITTEWAPPQGRSQQADAAGALLSRVVIERYFQTTLEWLERRSREDPEWVGAASLNDAIVYMTPTELRELDAKIRDFLRPYVSRLENLTPPEEGARPVSVIALGFPMDDDLFGG